MLPKFSFTLTSVESSRKHPLVMSTPSILDFDDYRAFLKATLEEKARKNPTFSLRAFARLANMSPSHLSRALSGQKKLSAASAHQISRALGHNARESTHLLNLVELEKATDEVERGRILSRLAAPNKKTRILPIETFKVISDWYHFAILSLMNTRGFHDNAAWIARRLGIKPLEARFAIDRLANLGLIERTTKGLKLCEDANITTTDDIPSAAINENHRQHLHLAERALTEVETELREFNNLALSMRLSDVPKAKRLIRAFLEQCNQELETTSNADEVYQINVQFYPLSKREKGLT